MTQRLIAEPGAERGREMNERDVVRFFGKSIGYGRLMQLASELWRENLINSGYPPGGEFTLGPCKAMTVPCSHIISDANGHCDVCCGAGRITEWVSRAVQKEVRYCPKGHDTEAGGRDKNGHCKACNREYAARHHLQPQPTHNVTSSAILDAAIALDRGDPATDLGLRNLSDPRALDLFWLATGATRGPCRTVDDVRRYVSDHAADKEFLLAVHRLMLAEGLMEMAL